MPGKKKKKPVTTAAATTAAIPLAESKAVTDLSRIRMVDYHLIKNGEKVVSGSIETLQKFMSVGLNAIFEDTVGAADVLYFHKPSRNELHNIVQIGKIIIDVMQRSFSIELREIDNKKKIVVFFDIEKKWFQENEIQAIKEIIKNSDEMRKYIVYLTLPMSNTSVIYSELLGTFCGNISSSELQAEHKEFLLKNKASLIWNFLSYVLPELKKCGADVSCLNCMSSFDMDIKEILIESLGASHFDEVPEGLSFLHQLFSMSISVDSILNDLPRLINAGLNVNKQNRYGTFIHQAMANEMFIKVLSAIDVLEEIKEEKLAAQETSISHLFDYTRVDPYGRTPLMLFVCTRFKTANDEKSDRALLLNKFAELHHKKIDIGVNVPDKDGITPFLAAAIRRDLTAMKMLETCGANTKAVDKQGRGLKWYATQSTAEDIRKAYASVHINVDRDVNAPHNFIYFDDPLRTPLWYAESKREDKKVLIAKTPIDHWKMVKSLVKEAKKLRPALANEIERQLVDLAGVSLLDTCLANQAEVNKYIDKFLSEAPCLFETGLHPMLSLACFFKSLPPVKEIEFSVVSKAADADLEKEGIFGVMRIKS